MTEQSKYPTDEELDRWINETDYVTLTSRPHQVSRVERLIAAALNRNELAARLDAIDSVKGGTWGTNFGKLFVEHVKQQARIAELEHQHEWVTPVNANGFTPPTAFYSAHGGSFFRPNQVFCADCKERPT